MSILFWVLGALALLGMPVFAVMGGASELAWLTHPDPAYRHLRYIAPTVLDERFAGSPILVTIPLFTLVGYLMAESKTPDRIVQASRAFFGWMPGGLALVAIAASAFFTTLTGGSGVTIVAIGGLLYPALRKQRYPEAFSLGLVTTGGSLGLLLPPSLPILIYALVAGIDFTRAFKAALLPGLLVMALLYAYSAYVGIKAGVPRDPPRLSAMGQALWLVKWELFIPVIIVGGLLSGLTSLDESAAITALYTFIVEVFVYKDLSIVKDLPRVAKGAMSLSGAVILILAMANALINFVVQEQIPGKMLEKMVSFGLTERWQFLIVLNIFLLLLGMIMDGFSAILVAVPLVLPFAARFHLAPFHLAVMFLLNLELAFMLPPLGLNLFIASFRFNRPVASLYRVVLPFAGLVAAALIIITYVPAISVALILPDIAAARASAEATHSSPFEAWQLECVQADTTHPMPCTAQEAALFPAGDSQSAASNRGAPAGEGSDKSSVASDDDLFREMLGASVDGGVN
jgi:tripartite ATP-independent transporter DctM subunit